MQSKALNFIIQSNKLNLTIQKNKKKIRKLRKSFSQNMNPKELENIVIICFSMTFGS